MKKNCALLLAFCVFNASMFANVVPSSENDSFLLRTDNDINFILEEMNKVSDNLSQMVDALQFSEKHVLGLLQTVSDLISQSIKNSKGNFANQEDKIEACKQSEKLYFLFSQLVCDFFAVLEFNKVEVSSLSKDLKYLSLIEKSKTREAKTKFLREFVEKQDMQGLTDFIHEFSVVFSSYLNNELDVFVDDTKSKICLYLEQGVSEDSLEEPLIFRRAGKKRKIFSAIFKAIASACVTLSKIFSSKDQRDKKENVLDLCGTAFNLVAEVNSIQAERANKKCLVKIDQEPLINITVQTIEELYLLLKQTNLAQGKESRQFLLEKLDSFASAAERRIWIEKALKTRGLTDKLLTAVFKCLKKCIQEVIERLVDILSDKALEMAIQYATGNKELLLQT